MAQGQDMEGCWAGTPNPSAAPLPRWRGLRCDTQQRRGLNRGAGAAPGVVVTADPASTPALRLPGPPPAKVGSSSERGPTPGGWCEASERGTCLTGRVRSGPGSGWSLGVALPFSEPLSPPLQSRGPHACSED